MLLEEIKMLIKRERCRFFLVIPFLLFNSAVLLQKLQAQVVWEDHKKEVYHYLSRMAQKGLINFDDNIRPISRKYIGDCLDLLLHKPTELSALEKKELTFYCREYGYEMNLETNNTTKAVQSFRTDPYKRWRSFYGSDGHNFLVADPVFTAGIIRAGACRC